VRWWDENVSIRQHANQHNVVNADAALTKDRAESATGISQQQVSRWRKSLRDPQKYRGTSSPRRCRNCDPHPACPISEGYRIEAEHRACEIRLRAERKAGQLLAERDNAQGRRSDLMTPRYEVDAVKTLDELGVSPRQSSDW
jgi:hypothetical protein